MRQHGREGGGVWKGCARAGSVVFLPLPRLLAKHREREVRERSPRVKLAAGVYVERRCRKVIRLGTSPKAACLEERCREVIQLRSPPRAACFERRRREVVRLRIPPKAACFEERCREDIQLRTPPKAACFERRCRGVVRLRIPPKAAFPEERCRLLSSLCQDCLQNTVRLGFVPKKTD